MKINVVYGSRGYGKAYEELIEKVGDKIMKDRFYLKYGNFYIDDLDVDIFSIDTEFIRFMSFKTNKTSGCDTYTKKEIEFLVSKLVLIGFNKELFKVELKLN